jgi:hypothetical protein
MSVLKLYAFHTMRNHEASDISEYTYIFAGESSEVYQ